MSYATLEYADNYVSTYYISTDPLRVAWDGFTETDREILLSRSYQDLERVPYTGKRTDPEQESQFPRYPDTEVPTAVMSAQVANALAYTDTSWSEDALFYGRLKALGVTSYSLGNLSESLSEGSYSSAASMIKSPDALSLLSPWMCGGYRVT